MAAMPILQQQSMYYQELLAAQYNVSKLIEHRLTKGELREQFVKDVVCRHFDRLCFYTGVLAFDTWQSPQIDFIWLTSHASTGVLRVFRAKECKLFMEIKSEAEIDEFAYLNDYACKIKTLCPDIDIKAGMFCYSTQASRKNIIKNLGFKYDKNIKSYKAYDKTIDLYHSIDFVYGLDLKGRPKRPFFIMRDLAGNNDLFLDEPVIDYFLRLFKE